MLEPVQTLARFIATGDARGLDNAFAAAGVVITENFAPFLFEGRAALARWRAGFEMHRVADELTDLQWRFGEAQDFALDGETAYFVLPTTWTGRTHGRPFSEDGGWAFVLEQAEGRWRVKSYAWAVTAKR